MQQSTLFPLNEILPLRLSKATLRRLIGEGTPICNHTLKKQLIADGIILPEEWPTVERLHTFPVRITLKIYEVYQIKSL